MEAVITGHVYSQVIPYQASCLVADRKKPDEENTDGADSDGEYCKSYSVMKSVPKVQARNHKYEDDGAARSIVYKRLSRCVPERLDED